MLSVDLCDGPSIQPANVFNAKAPEFGEPLKVKLDGLNDGEGVVAAVRSPAALR